ncbi:hypothetical protein ABT173_37350 [Streptomyces sp. NPDC001795]|uniref:hypothetical protein n=1 Tax=Streptomyces sp. NPDC001795 TaxID=3154525 RepID=UPI003316BDBB
MSDIPSDPIRPNPISRAPAADDTEHLLDAAARGEGPAEDPLAALLTAAATPDPADALAGEDAAVAEFRAAGNPAPTVWRRAIRAAAAAALAALAFGGVAVAADHAGLHLPLLPHHPARLPRSSPGTQHNPTPPAATTPTGTSTPATHNGTEAPRDGRGGLEPHASRGRARGRDQHTTPARDRGKADRDKHLSKGLNHHHSHTGEYD